MVVALLLDSPLANAFDLHAFPAWNSFARTMSHLGEGWVVGVAGLLGAAGLALCHRPKWARMALVVTVAALLTGATATLLRSLIGRTRPNAHAPQGLYGVRYQGRWILGKYDFGAFPSGHAATAVALVTALWLANRRAGLAAAPYGVLVSWSRVAQGSHHFSDVVAAACLGVCGARLFAAPLDLLFQSAGHRLRLAYARRSRAPASAAQAPAPDCLSPAATAAAVNRLGLALGGELPGPLLSVVVPCHNEEGNLAPLAAAIARVMAPLGLNWELVVTDDRSTDGSWQVLAELATADARVRGQRLARNSGQSAALWAGLQSARGRLLVTMDADLQNAPEDLPRLLAALENCDCACGTRVATRKHGDRVVRRLASRLANWVRNRVTRESVTDSGCGYRVFRRECVENLKYFQGMHRFLPTLIRMEGFTVAEVPVTHHPRRSGRSHYGLWDRLLTSSWDLLAVRWMQARMGRYHIQEALNPGPTQTGQAQCAATPSLLARTPPASWRYAPSAGARAEEPVALPGIDVSVGEPA